MRGGGGWRERPIQHLGHQARINSFTWRRAHRQRFAIDFVQLREDGRTFTGDQKDNKNYRCYGAEALAVADGVVVAVKDGIPENVPGANSRAVPITLETVGGNHVILDVGNGRFAFYAHLQPGSLRVKLGGKVRRGQVLGLVGNSGNSTEAASALSSQQRQFTTGLRRGPYAFPAFEVQGKDGMESWIGKLSN